MTTGINVLPTDTSNLLWNFSPNRLLNPNVKVIFRGLMAFCYHTGNRQCEVAFNRKDPLHRLRIEVKERDVAQPLYILTSVPTQVKIELGIQAKANDVAFYYQGLPNQFDRRTGHENDFRWLLDLESDDGYGRRLDKDAGFFNTKLFLRHGTLYTHQPTDSTFMSLGILHFKYVGNLPKYTGAEIQMAAGDQLYLKINGTDVLAATPIDPAKQYEIYFLNECFDAAGHRCTGNDFGLNFEAIDQADIPKPLRFALLPLFIGLDLPPTGLEISKDYKPQNNDSAPCMGVGFGQSSGFPPEA